VDARLLRAIATSRIQNQAGELVELSLRALDHLKRLDENLYERFVASRNAPGDRAANAASLQRLWDDTFAALLQLLMFCRSIAPTHEPTPEVATEIAMPSFEFGDLEAPAAPASNELDLGSSDIGDLLENIDEQVDVGDAERWAKVLEKIGSIEYGLSSQYADATARMHVALAAGEIGQVLGALDDTASSASEGVHALVAAVYEEFVPEVNPASVVPGYLTALGRALLVRRGLAELGSTLAPYNDILQGDQTHDYNQALATIRDVMRTFVSSVVCRAMRPADRWQMVEFERELSEQPLGLAKLTSEGLVKYLDSLSSINQREVLLLHDQRTLDDMRESLANARQLMDISPRTAYEMVDRAYQAAQQLRGRHPVTDQLVVQLERNGPTSTEPSEITKFLERLEALLAAAGS
jgi:hypothetical protein